MSFKNVYSGDDERENERGRKGKKGEKEKKRRVELSFESGLRWGLFRRPASRKNGAGSGDGREEERAEDMDIDLATYEKRQKVSDPSPSNADEDAKGTRAVRPLDG